VEDKFTQIGSHFKAPEDLENSDSQIADKNITSLAQIHQDALKEVDYLEGGIHVCTIPTKYLDIKLGDEQAGPALEALEALEALRADYE
jgi:hypothetical protein